jgi:hypothetical protein
MAALDLMAFKLRRREYREHYSLSVDWTISATGASARPHECVSLPIKKRLRDRVLGYPIA